MRHFINAAFFRALKRHAYQQLYARRALWTGSTRLTSGAKTTSLEDARDADGRTTWQACRRELRAATAA